MSENRVIGKGNALPWRLPVDLARFKSVTLGHPMIMGRLTYESIGRPLPGRVTIVVTRDKAWSAPEGVELAYTLEEALRLAEHHARELKVGTIMVVGGANIYAQFLPHADALFVTEVHTYIEGDAYFPELSGEAWRELNRVEIAEDERNTLACAFVEYEKYV